jgi:SAM-dependent methyltransferase
MKYNREFVERYAVGTVEHRKIIVPALTTALGNVKGRTVLDLGCGNGRYARLLAQQGALVTGIDRNQNQLAQAIAQEQAEKLGIVYREADIRTARVENGTYDIALLMFVIVDVRTAATVKKLISVASHALKTGGLLVIADLHPHNINRENTLENFRAKNGKGYFDNGAEACSRARLEDGTELSFDPNFHYRLDFVLNTLVGKGFCLKKFLEPRYRVEFPTHMIIISRRM